MGNKYQILAAKYPFNGYYEKSFQCNTLWIALVYFREYKRQGYDIIDVHYRDIKETFTCAFSED